MESRQLLEKGSVYPLIEGRCKMCKCNAIIVYQDFYHEKSSRPFLQLCLSCCKEYMVEEYNRVIQIIPKKMKRECKDCGEIFLIGSSSSWANKCFNCWKISKDFNAKIKQAELDFNNGQSSSTAEQSGSSL